MAKDNTRRTSVMLTIMIVAPFSLATTDLPGNISFRGRFTDSSSDPVPDGAGGLINQINKNISN